jgi:S1-C subfamily serine protease
VNEEHEKQEEREVPEAAGQSSMSRGFVVGLLALGVLLGFSIGLLVVGSGFTGFTGPSVLFDQDLVTELFDRASPAVVELDVSLGFGIGSGGTGSGFFVDREGRIVTSNHVVDSARTVRVRLHDGRTLEATKLGNSPADDLALLQVDPAEVSGIDPLPLADSLEVVPGQMAVAIGSPFRNFNSVTVGVVSGRGRAPVSAIDRPIPDMIQTDAPLNSGNSGGPLLNSSGEVIGVNSSIRTSPFQGMDEFRIGFAVPSNTLEDLLPQLIVAEEVRRPWLGISSRPISADLMEDLGIPSGIAIASVFNDSPAQSIGLEPFRTVRGDIQGDVITAVDGNPVSSVDQMVSYFNTLLPGHTITLTVYRDESTIDLDATLAPWPDT